MDYKAQTIKNRLSLRKPQADSLEILNKLSEVLELKKGADSIAELAKVRALYPTCADFERDFPSVCFALATGVGKTRLMGAFITYLYVAKGIKNFFVLAPNLTIYEKLKAELNEPNHPKYVFRGIAEFASMPPRIITGDNYEEARQGMLFNSEVHINIFNISKINSEVRGGREPRIKRLSEYLGESYFNYLASLPDLVLLMDESHHYRADAGLRAINELKPILGLELTATPIDTHKEKFKNVVFDYPLALALKDGFVKEPAVATRKDFNPDQYRHDPKELDLIKLEDGVRIHEDTKVNLEIYARDTGNRIVRPFVLVVARDINHANEIRAMIESDRFFEGRYRGKVMEIYSNQRGGEKDFAAILETDRDVLKWLRPAQAQFSMYWNHNSQRYTPDFIVETKEVIYMIEIKAETDINDADVQEKAEAGKKYCEAVIGYNLQNGGKCWTYALIPHTAVVPNMSFHILARNSQ